MGFFGNIWDGIKSAGQWALDHSADVIPVVKTVAKVAGMLAMDDDMVPKHIDMAIQASITAEDVNIDHYQKLFGYCNKRLIAASSSGAKIEQSTFVKAKSNGGISTHGSTTTVSDNLSGVWTMPNGLDSEGHPSASMYADLSNFMATMNIPRTVKVDNTTTDLVNQLGACLFVKNGAQPDSKDTTEANPIQSSPCSIDMGNGNSIHSAHVFYRLPLGKGATSYALHSAITINYLTTDENQASFLASCKDISFCKSLTTDVSQWMVTLDVTWASVTAAQGAQQRFMANFAKENESMVIGASQINGTLQLLKVSATTNSTPAAVRFAVRSAATAALASLTSATYGDASMTAANGYPAITVEVEVTDSSLLCAAPPNN